MILRSVETKDLNKVTLIGQKIDITQVNDRYYLFFPDNAHGCKYVGKQPYNFMVDGVERKMNEAINIMLDKLINKFEE